MHPSPVTDLKTFVPTKDSELSKKLYSPSIGATIRLQSFRSARYGSCCRPCRRECGKSHDESSRRGCGRLVGAHPAPGVHEEVSRHYVQTPAMQPWGIRVLYLSDPTGVLWHITDMRKS
jgi:hypothetical protein